MVSSPAILVALVTKLVSPLAVLVPPVGCLVPLVAVPVPLVFFTHQNPVDWDEDVASGGPQFNNQGSGGPHQSDGVLPSATDDVLLHCELVRLLVEAARQMGAYKQLVDRLPRRLHRMLKDARRALLKN